MCPLWEGTTLAERNLREDIYLPLRVPLILFHLIFYNNV